MSRPEEISPPEIVSYLLSTTCESPAHYVQFYGDTEAAKYTANTRIKNIQSQMTERALQLLALPEDQSAYVLDIGCGSGLSGELLDEEGHVWVGVDVAPSMLGKSDNMLIIHTCLQAAQRLPWKEKSRETYFCTTLDKGLVLDQVHSMVP